MAPGSSPRPVATLIVRIALLIAVTAGCGQGPSPTPGAIVEPTPIAPEPSVAGRDGPPDATLGAEGGDPVTGQIGTYVWLDTGSDSPWLPGAPLVVGRGEPLTVRLVPGIDIQSWVARFVRADARGPEGAVTLGRGTASGSFAAPEPGVWTVQVSIVFGAGAGNADYFWRLEVE
jgi:hypothetical protein